MNMKTRSSGSKIKHENKVMPDIECGLSKRDHTLKLIVNK